MKSCLTALAAASFLFSCEAVAQDGGQTFQDCGTGTSRSIVETGPQAALNDFGGIDQTVLGVSATLGFCTTGSQVRWRLEGNYVHVDEDLYKADGVLIGIGFTARPIDSLSGFTVTPIGRLGYETNSADQPNFLYGGSVTFEFVTPMGPDHASGPSLQAVLVERPEYVVRSVVQSSAPVTSGSNHTFSNFASAGLDGSFGRTSRWRWKADLASTSIAEDEVTTNQIFSGIVSIRPTTSNGASYPWSVELWLGRGNGNYRGVLLSFTLRFD
jgi:hypothetical protein